MRELECRGGGGLGGKLGLSTIQGPLTTSMYARTIAHVHREIIENIAS